MPYKEIFEEDDFFYMGSYGQNMSISQECDASVLLLDLLLTELRNDIVMTHCNMTKAEGHRLGNRILRKCLGN